MNIHVLELFFVQSGMFIQPANSVVLEKNKNWVHKSEFIVDYLSSALGRNYAYKL